MAVSQGVESPIEKALSKSVEDDGIAVEKQHHRTDDQGNHPREWNARELSQLDKSGTSEDPGPEAVPALKRRRLVDSSDHDDQDEQGKDHVADAMGGGDATEPGKKKRRLAKDAEITELTNIEPSNAPTRDEGHLENREKVSLQIGLLLRVKFDHKRTVFQDWARAVEKIKDRHILVPRLDNRSGGVPRNRPRLILRSGSVTGDRE